MKGSRAGLSQADVARRLDEGQTWVSKVELGERRLDVLELLRVSDALGIPLCEFMNKLKTGPR